MNLLIDIGNSRIKWIFSNNLEDGCISASEYRTSNIRAVLEDKFSNIGVIENIYVSNVAGCEIELNVFQWFVDTLGIEPQFARSTRSISGLVNRYVNPNLLGVDRMLAMLGAKKSEFPFVVADCGTAVTIDCVTQHGEFIGGIIVPGVMAMKSVLEAQTNQLNNVEVDDVVTPFQKETASAIHSGCVLAIAKTIENSVAEFRSLSHSNVDCFVTGGDGAYIKDYLNIDVKFQDDLVLRGLKNYFQAVQ